MSLLFVSWMGGLRFGGFVVYVVVARRKDYGFSVSWVLVWGDLGCAYVLVCWFALPVGLGLGCCVVVFWFSWKLRFALRVCF